VSFDTNLRLNLWSLEEARAAADEVLPLADIVFPSDDEAEQLTGLSDPDAVLDHYLGFGAKIVALKRGGKGVRIATPALRTDIAPAPSTPVDSTGAGDSFAGAFLAYFLETGDVVRAGQLAAKVAAGTVSGFGAISPIPRRDQVWSD
jgi:2-dehydro-3-deoxygluconokinase